MSIPSVQKHIDWAPTAQPNKRLQRQIGQIDRLVYELYGLTEEEIAIVEEATR